MTKRPRFDRQDLSAAGLLALIGLLLRLATLPRIALNPDESQFEAGAAFLLADGTSAFAQPYGAPWTTTLYKAVAAVFGPYSMYEVRTLVLLIALGTAWILYDVVRREAGWAWGLLAGVLFLHVNQAFEGWTANREWFSFFPALLGFWLAMRAADRERRRNWAIWLLAGLLCGMSLWFKRQASFLVLVVPTVLLARAWSERSLGPRLRQLLPFAAGGLLAGSLFVLPFLIHGTLEAYFGTLFSDYSDFVGRNEAMVQQRSGGALDLYTARLFWNLPHRSLFLLAYSFAAIVLVDAVRRCLRGADADAPDGRSRSSGTLLVAVYLVAALGCAKLGNRFFGHYFLYVAAPLAASVALAGGWLARRLAGAAGRWLATAVLLLLLLERADALSAHRFAVFRVERTTAIMYGIYLLAVLGLALVAVRRGKRRAAFLLAGMVLLESAAAVVYEQRRPLPPSFPYHRDAFGDLAERIRVGARPGDRLFVWGWLPEVYSAVRLEPASFMTITEFVVNDYYPDPDEPAIDPTMAESMMRDLDAHPPRFVVDATTRSWTMVAGGDTRLYRLENYPDFEFVALLRERYRRVGRYDGCELYERVED